MTRIKAKIIKLTNGETILCDVHHMDDKSVAVLNPLMLDLAENPNNGRPMLYATSWVPLTEDINVVDIKAGHVIAMATISDEIDLYYRKSLKTFLDEGEEIIEEDDEEIEDRWMEKFGHTVEQVSANTVH
jgi:hypothetical protein